MSYANMDGVPTQTAGTSELLADDWNTYVRDNFDSIKFGHVVCTSSTRPTGIAEGTMIYETDTNKVLVYSGSSWIELHDIDNTNAFPAAASDLNNFFGAWTAYTPALTAETTNPTLGTGASITGSYLKVGKTVFYRIRIVAGSGVAAGNGTYYFSLPFAVAATQFDSPGFGWAYADNPLVFGVVAADASPGSSKIRLIGSNGGIVSSTNYEVANTNTIYVLSGTYETT